MTLLKITHELLIFTKISPSSYPHTYIHTCYTNQVNIISWGNCQRIFTTVKFIYREFIQIDRYNPSQSSYRIFKHKKLGQRNFIIFKRETYKIAIKGGT